MAGAASKHFASAYAVVRTQAKPGREVPLGLPSAHIQADFGDNSLGGKQVDAVNAAQIRAGDTAEFRVQVEVWLIALGLAVFTLHVGQRLLIGRFAAGEG